MSAFLQAISGVVIVSLISFVGIFTISIKPQKLKKYVIYLVSFAAGALFGGAFIHLLPKAIKKTGPALDISLYILSGIVIMFVVEKIIHWRHCHNPKECDVENQIQPVALMNLIGDGVHNFMDGLVIGASFLVSTNLGIATTIAVIVHEIPQEIGDFGVLLHGGFSRFKALLVNFVVAVTAILGVVTTFVLAGYIENITSILIPFTIGNFVYIAGADLIPELHHQESDITKSTLQLITFMAGIGVMWLVFIVNHAYIK